MKKVTELFQWQDFVVKDIEKKHNITAQAKRDGSGDEPPTSAERFSVFENEIAQECYTYIDDHTNRLSDYLKNIEDNQNTLSSDLKKNHFEPIVNKVDLDFHTLANKKEIELSDLKNNYNTYKGEQIQFQKYHQISREPNYAIPSKTYKAIGLILVLFIIEIALNGFMLHSSLVGGIIDGIAVATSVAFINVCVSALIGYYIFKNITHLEKTRKILYSFFASIYTGLIIYINTCLGAYRSESQRLFLEQFGNIGEGKTLTNAQIQEALSLVITPWNVEFIFMGIILTFVGLSFAFISVMDGYTYNDTYPGYGKLGQIANKYKDQIKKTFKSYADEVAQLFSENNKILQMQFDNVLKNQLDNWDSNTNLIQKEFITYRSKVNAIETKGWHIIEEYREQNKRVRKSPAPKYFKDRYTIDESKKDPKLVFEHVAWAYMDDKMREERKLKFSENIDKMFKVAEQEVEALQKKSVEKQNELHEKYNTP